MKLKLSAILLLIAVFVSHSFGATIAGDAGSKGYKFLQQGIGARTIAMGGAGTALSGDLSQSYWNPAGLAHPDQGAGKGYQVSFEHTIWLADIGYDAIGYVKSTPLGTFGITALFQSSGDIPFTASLIDGQYVGAPEPQGTFGVYDGAVWASFARQMERLSLGVSARYIYEKIHISTSQAVAFDVGAQYTVGRVTLGAVIRNLGRSSRLREVRTPLPWDIKVGVATRAKLPVAGGSILGAVDLRKAPDAYETVHAGTEITLWDHLFIRFGLEAGLAKKLDNQGFSAGLGLKWSRFSFGYALRSYRHSLGSPHTISLTLMG